MRVRRDQHDELHDLRHALPRCDAAGQHLKRVVLDILVQGRRNATAAKRFFKRLLVGLRYKPKRIVTDGRAATARRNARPCPTCGTGRAAT
ncbi:DDE-type integrase/transposase/recombinase [Siccirubricoccus soli]|uniref:DDE-type integrase/transposase/recombinase n=1 Tax=Siccirubricoccus soli TaxID=2899147 RepID=UPI003515CDD3